MCTWPGRAEGRWGPEHKFRKGHKYRRHIQICKARESWGQSSKDRRCCKRCVMLVLDKSEVFCEVNLRFRSRNSDGGNSQDADNRELHFDNWIDCLNCFERHSQTSGHRRSLYSLRKVYLTC